MLGVPGAHQGKPSICPGRWRIHPLGLRPVLRVQPAGCPYCHVLQGALFFEGDPNSLRSWIHWSETGAVLVKNSVTPVLWLDSERCGVSFGQLRPFSYLMLWQKHQPCRGFECVSPSPVPYVMLHCSSAKRPMHSRPTRMLGCTARRTIGEHTA